MGSRRKFQIDGGVVLIINFYAFYLVQSFDARLYLYCLCGFITESLYKIFCVLYLLLLVSICTHLLFSTLFAQFHKLGIWNFIIINVSARYFNGTIGYRVKKSPIMTDQQYGRAIGFQKILQPLDGL